MTLLYLTVAYMLGIWLGKWVWDYGLLHCDLPHWLWSVPLGLLLFVPLLYQWEKKKPGPLPTLRWPTTAGFEPPRPPLSLAMCIGLLLCVLMGVLRYASHPLTPCWTPADLAYYNLPASRAFDRVAARLTLEGYIDAYPTQEDGRHRLYIAIETIMLDDVERSVHGKLLLRSTDNRHFEYGAPVRLSGRLATPPDFEDFSYREYLARRGIHSMLYDAQIEPLTNPLQGLWFYRAIYTVRARGERLINQALPEPYAALANGILLGVDGGIPDELYDQFNLVGISHLLVISGSNVALIAAFALVLSQRIVGQKRAVYPALVAIATYALLVGGDAAVLRAALMGGLVVFAGAVQRRSTALISLAAAAAWLTLLNPLSLWDVGFQLSSMATAGLILFVPPLTAWASKVFPGFQGSALTAMVAPSTVASGDRTQGFFRSLIADSLIVTLAANVMVLPLIVFYFGRLSVISLLANLLVAAVQPLILLAGTVGLLIGLLGLPFVAKIFFWITWLALFWTTFVARWSAQLPGASLEIASYGWHGLLFTYALIFAQRFYAGWMRRQNSRWAAHVNTAWIDTLRPLLLGALALIAAVIWSAVVTLPDGRLHVYFLQVDGGAGMLIQTPSGRQILIDGGRIPQQLISELGKVMPYWDRSLDLLVITQPKGTDLDALAELPRRLHISHVIDSASNIEESQPTVWRTTLMQTATSVTTMERGGWIDLGDGVTLWIVWPSSEASVVDNSAHTPSVVLKIVYDDFGMLVTGNNGSLDLYGLLHTGIPLQASLLQTGAKLGDHPLYQTLVTNVNPQITILHGGKDFPDDASTTQILSHPTESKVRHIARSGHIHFTTDSQTLWLQTDAQP